MRGGTASTEQLRDVSAGPLAHEAHLAQVQAERAGRTAREAAGVGTFREDRQIGEAKRDIEGAQRFETSVRGVTGETKRYDIETTAKMQINYEMDEAKLAGEFKKAIAPINAAIDTVARRIFDEEFNLKMGELASKRGDAANPELTYNRCPLRHHTFTEIRDMKNGESKIVSLCEWTSLDGNRACSLPAVPLLEAKAAVPDVPLASKSPTAGPVEAKAVVSAEQDLRSLFAERIKSAALAGGSRAAIHKAIDSLLDGMEAAVAALKKTGKAAVSECVGITHSEFLTKLRSPPRGSVPANRSEADVNQLQRRSHDIARKQFIGRLVESKR